MTWHGNLPLKQYHTRHHTTLNPNPLYWTDCLSLGLANLATIPTLIPANMGVTVAMAMTTIVTPTLNLMAGQAQPYLTLTLTLTLILTLTLTLIN